MSKKIRILFLLSPYVCFALDPFGAKNQAGSGLPLLAKCTEPSFEKPLTLIELVDSAICNNPNAKIAYENALYQSCQVAVSKSAYLPTLSASGSVTSNEVYKPNSQSYNQNSLGISASLLLYDFGGREASHESAKALLQAVSASSNQTLQDIFYTVFQGYYGALAGQANVESAKESLKASDESLKAAASKYEASVATKSDKLQAQTAYSNAKLSYIKAQGEAKKALSTLLTSAGLSPVNEVKIVKPLQNGADINVDEVGRLIIDAKKTSPAIKSAMASVESARANVAVAEANGMPNLSLTTSASYMDKTTSQLGKGADVGLYLNIPIFTGFSSTYKIKAAKEQLKIKEAEFQKAQKQIELDVVTSYQDLTTQKEALMAAGDAALSAQSSYDMALGRYKAGVIGIVELLNTQSALASANEQKIKAQYGLAVAKAALAKSIGRLGFDDIKSNFGQQ